MTHDDRTTCTGCGATPCDCDREIWNYRRKHEDGKTSWGGRYGVAMDRRTALSVYAETTSMQPDGIQRGPVQRITEPAYVFDVVQCTCDNTTHECPFEDHAARIWSHRTRVIATGEEHWSGSTSETSGHDRAWAIHSQAKHVEVAARLRDQPGFAFMVGPVQRVTDLPFQFVGPTLQGPVEDPSVPETFVGEPTITVTQTELARLLFETTGWVFDEAHLRGEVDEINDDEKAAERKLRHAFDVLQKTVEPKQYERCERRAERVFGRKANRDRL